VRQVVVPAENLSVPLADFGQVWAEAERLYREDPQNRYVAAVLCSCQWVARDQPDSPLTGDVVQADPATIHAEMTAASRRVYGMPGALEVHEEWALGVMSVLGWVCGVLSRRPFQARRVAA
jgi:hypothetical protein